MTLQIQRHLVERTFGELKLLLIFCKVEVYCKEQHLQVWVNLLVVLVFQGNATFNLGGANKVIINGADLDGSTINGNADIVGGAVTTFTDLNVTGVLGF